jgi:hypothetical protein
MPEFEKFRQYSSAEQAAEVLAKLEAVGIAGLISDNQPHFDAAFAYNTAQRLYTLSLSPEEFAHAEALLDQWAEAEAQVIDPDHYLLTFDIEELYDVLRHPSEWSVLDIKIATRLLRERGHTVTKADLDRMRQAEVAAQSQHEPVGGIWLANGYLFALMGGAFGILIGYIIWSAKKQLPDGSKIYLHPDNERSHGKNMMLIGVVMFFIILAVSTFVPYVSDYGYRWW